MYVIFQIGGFWYGTTRDKQWFPVWEFGNGNVIKMTFNLDIYYYKEYKAAVWTTLT